MIKRCLAALGLVLALAPVLRSDWKSELLSRLAPRPDYRSAYDFLVEELKKLEPEDRQTVGILLPYLAGKLGDVDLERSLAADYFETYRDNDPDFGFLDGITLREFIAFWARWKTTYPLAYDVNLLSYPKIPASGVPASVELGLEILNEAFYRISIGPYILEGGHWSRGFHILTLPVRGLFERSDTYEFVLDLKSGDLIVRKPIRLRVDVANLVIAPAPAPRETLFPEPGMPARAIREGELSLYIDNKLILRSRKIAAKPSPLSFPLPGPSMPGQKPYLPPPKEGPMVSGVSILDALALAYTAIKGLVAKKPPRVSPPSYQKVTSLSFDYSRTTAEGLASSARTSISLVNVRAFVLRE